MSRQIYGDYTEVMKTVNSPIFKTFKSQKNMVIVIKIVNTNLN